MEQEREHSPSVMGRFHASWMGGRERPLEVADGMGAAASWDLRNLILPTERNVVSHPVALCRQTERFQVRSQQTAGIFFSGPKSVSGGLEPVWGAVNCVRAAV